MFKNILIPTDGSETAAKAVKAGVALAKEMGAKVTGYCAREPVPLHLYREGGTVDRKLIDTFERRAEEFAKKSVGALAVAAKAAGVPYRSVITKTPVPYKGIINAAKEQNCDAIFIASHGQRGIKRLLLGSVTQEVLAHSDLPVLVFR